MISALQKQPNGNISLTITISASEVKKAWEEILQSSIKNISIPGFRKGNAPRKLAEEKIDKERVREEVLKKLLPTHYVNAIREHNIHPVINPKIHVEKLEDPQTLSESKGWQFTALTCEAPGVELNDYKDKIKSLTAKAASDAAKSKIIVPGREVKFEEIVKALLESVVVKIPEILLENEVERLLSQTLDEIKRLGLNLDQYLSSTGRTAESLRDEYKKRAENDLKLEFAVQKIAEIEKITVEEKEIDEAILKAKSEEERKNLESNRYLLANILRQQKTLDFIKNL